MRLGALQQLVFFFEFRRLHLLEIFFETLQPFLDLAEVADHEIEFHILDVAQRIDFASMWNRGILENTHDVGQRIDLP